MTDFVKYNLRNGESIPSVVILLETEFSQMKDRVSDQWIAEVQKGKG